LAFLCWDEKICIFDPVIFMIPPTVLWIHMIEE